MTKPGVGDFTAIRDTVDAVCQVTLLDQNGNGITSSFTSITITNVGVTIWSKINTALASAVELTDVSAIVLTVISGAMWVGHGGHAETGLTIKTGMTPTSASPYHVTAGQTIILRAGN